MSLSKCAKFGCNLAADFFTQNLSQSIRNLEDELGCFLITRTNKGVSFTDKGKDFVQYSQDIINQFDHPQIIGKDSTDANTIHSKAHLLHDFPGLNSYAGNNCRP